MGNVIHLFDNNSVGVCMDGKNTIRVFEQDGNSWDSLKDARLALVEQITKFFCRYTGAIIETGRITCTGCEVKGCQAKRIANS